MPNSEEYRRKAAEMNARAKQEQNPLTRAELENLALAYLRLADQAERNATVDLVYETPSPRSQPVTQQQQQPQTKDKSEKD
jgi:hypothetical protein